jgi:hypothetical protein
MSGGGKSSTSTSSVSIPPEVLARYNAVNARAESVAQQGFTPYGGQFVAPLTPTQQAGIANVGQAAGQAQPYFGAATQSLLSGAAQAQPYYGAATQSLATGQAGANQFNQAAAGNITGAQAGAQPYQGLATGYALAGSQGVQPGQLNTQAYMSPYIQSVADPTFAALRQQQQQEQQNIMGNQIRSGAFGGDRGKIAQAVLAQQQGLSTAQAMGNIYQQGYGQALSTAQQQQGLALSAEQANRQARQQAANQFLNIGQQGFMQGMTAAQQQAALGQQVFGQGATAAQQQAALGQGLYGMGAGVSQGLAGLGTGAQQAALQGGQAQLAAGTVEQQTQQANNQALYNQFLQQQGYPFQVAQFLANIAMGTGALSGSTTTTTQPSSFFSDERLKQDIEPIGKTFDGQEIVRFKYKGEPGTRIGLVAQDVEKKHPEAVGLAGGYKTVDYDAATDEAAARAPKAYGGGLSPWDGSSMGGSVFREDAGQGFAAGGAPGGDDVLAQINALVNAHQGMFPYGKAGLYGGGMGKAGPYGSTLMQAPSRNLMTAPPVRQEPPYDARQAMRDVRDISQMPKTIREGYSDLKAGLVGSPEQTRTVTSPSGQTTTEVTQQASSGALGRAGEINLRESAPARAYREVESWFDSSSAPSGNARGGAIRPGLAMGGLPYNQAENEYVPEDISKPIETPKLQTAPQTPMKDQGLEDAKTMMQMAATAAAIYGASDRRLKDNIEPIGKLFDGQNVYRYNFKGDDKKQIGLMAQEVEKRYPDAVGLAPRKGYEVGGPATEESRPTSPFDRAVNRTFGFEGGLNPRDSNGAPSNFGINQAANPDVNVRELTQDQAREIYRTRYWDRIGGDALAAQNPDLAHVAFDSAVIAGPNRTRQWLEQANGDVNRLLALREQHETELLRNDPDRFGPYRNAWASRRAGLAGDVNAGESATAGTLAGIGYPTQPRGGLEPRPGSMQERQQDWFGRNESWIMPLVTGLGTMASSPSRYLGSAVLQGLMGAGQAAQQQIGVAGQREKTEQDIKKSRAEEFQSLMQTEAVRAGIGSKSYDPRTNRWTVYNDRGEIISVSMAEYLEASRRGRPFRNAPGPSAREPFTPAEVTQPPLEAGPQRPATLPGQAQPAAAAAPSAPAVTRENLPPLPGQEGEAPPADQNAPMVSEPQEGQAAPATPGRLPPDQQTNLINRAAANVNSNPAIYSSLAQDQNFQDELNQRSQYLTNNASRLSARLPSASENPWNAIAEKADAAESTRVNRDNLANLFANLPVTGFTATGPIQQRITAPFVAGLNSILSALGFSGGINQSDVADRQAIDKALAALSTRAAAENNQRAVSAIDIVKSGIASGAMDQRAIGNAMAGMYVDAQRDIDRNNYASLWRRELEQKLGAGQEYLADYGGRDLSAAFDRRMANSYTREKTYLENLFQQTYRGEDGRYRNQPVWKVLSTSGGQPPRDLIAEMVNRYGDTGYRLLRYFNVTL